jgi:hypothetical protein
MRDYDPTTGRYLQADPLGLVDGPSVYGYARQSPVRWVDPTGRFSLAFAVEGDYFFLGGGGLSFGWFFNYDPRCGTLTYGSLETSKLGAGVDIQPVSVSLQVTGGSMDDLAGDSTSAEVDFLIGTVEVGQTASLKPVVGVEVGPPLLPVGGSVAFTETSIVSQQHFQSELLQNLFEAILGAPDGAPCGCDGR